MNKKWVIRYHSIQSDHILATPQFDYAEYVTGTEVQVIERIVTEKVDDWGNAYTRESKERMFGFDFISNTGAVDYTEYKEREFIEL